MTALLIRPASTGAGTALRRRRRNGTVATVSLLVLLLLLGVAVGAKPVPLDVVWQALRHFDPTNTEHVVVIEQRIPRTMLGVVVGAALGVAGALMQGMTRNPLADPGLLGVSAGAGFAMTMAVVFLPITSLLGYIWFSFAGAVLASVAVYALGTGRRGTNPLTLTLAGVSIGAVLSGLSLTLTILNPQAFVTMRSWESGSLADRGWDVILPVTAFVLIGLAFAAGAARGLNAVALGDDLAAALGANASRTRLFVVVAVTLLCGAATAAIGPVWFLGLMVPHLARWICGPDQRWIIGLSLLIGPCVLLAADILGRIVVRPDELQAGLVTAFVGAPVLIALVRRTKVSAL